MEHLKNNGYIYVFKEEIVFSLTHSCISRSFFIDYVTCKIQGRRKKLHVEEEKRYKGVPLAIR